MLRVSWGMTPGALYGHDHAGTWVWSDLHLGHTKTIEAFRRPFGTADEMNDTIFRNCTAACTWTATRPCCSRTCRSESSREAA